MAAYGATNDGRGRDADGAPAADLRRDAAVLAGHAAGAARNARDRPDLDGPPPDATTSLPAQVEVDSLRVYQAPP